MGVLNLVLNLAVQTSLITNKNWSETMESTHFLDNTFFSHDLTASKKLSREKTNMVPS